MHIPIFRKIVDKLGVTFRLGKGQGFIVNNKRVLHGRTDFKGYREMHRVLIRINRSSKFGSKIRVGFNP